MRRLAQTGGFTLVEMVVALAVSGMLMSILATSFYMLAKTPAEQSDQLNAVEDLRFAARWLTRDGQLAQTFASGTSPDYGSFSWADYMSSDPVTRSVTYAYSGTYLLRNEYVNSSLVSSQVVARNIADYNDVSFTYSAPQFLQNSTTGLWSLIGGIVTSTITSTVRQTGNPTDQVIGTTIVSQLRAQSERAVNSPGATPTPVPMPGQTGFYCASLNLIVGQYTSGGCAQLNAQDSSYYVLGSSQGGSTKYVTFEITSTVITNTSITEIDVSFVGQSSWAGTLQQLFVYNPNDPANTNGGYHPTVADQGFTYTKRDTNVATTWPLTAAQLNYIESLVTKTVRLKALASTTANYSLSVDQFSFSVR